MKINCLNLLTKTIFIIENSRMDEMKIDTYGDVNTVPIDVLYDFLLDRGFRITELPIWRWNLERMVLQYMSKK